MKGAVLALFCAVALASAELNENGCPINPYVDILKPHPNCNKYYQCQHGELTVRDCAGTLMFNEETQECDWPENVDCGNRDLVVPSSEENDSEDNKSSIEDNESSESGSDSAESGDSGGGNGKPSEAAEICAAEDSDGILVSHENCNQFYKCSEGKPVVFKCYGNLQFNPEVDQCDWPENVNCEDRSTGGGTGDGDSDNGNGDKEENGNGDGDNEDSGNGGSDNENNGGGNSDPNEASKICAAEGSDGVLVANENCNQFYKCSEGVPVALDCPSNLLYNPAKEQCDWPENVNCEGRSIGGGNGDNGNGDDGNGDGDNGGSENGNNGGGNSDPSKAPEICAAGGSDGVLVANENCNQFYKCSEGVPVALDCPSNLLYNPATEQCDWPENVNCEGRSIGGGNGDNGNGDDGNGDGDNGGSENGNNGGGNSDPSKAPEICAAGGSDGVLVANENCNQFYKCSEGVPVALDCPSNLLYNPATEQCDWPENVNCEGRSIGGGNGDNGNGNGDGDNGGSENGNNGGGNSDPSKAPEICAAGGSDGVLVANENCNQFYKCSEGVPVALDCPSNLLYNPATEQCDWPENVNCEGRSIGGGNGDNGNGDGGNGGGRNSDPSKAPEICAAGGSDGVLIANENCNQFYKCSEGVPVALSCPSNLLYNSATEQCDWPENVNCADRTPDSGDGDSGNGNGDGGSGAGGNANPSEAPKICAAEGSDGILVAHENCNQFYKCSEGVPVALSCYGDLLFNPANDQCDWPQNVNCGTRNIFTSFNKHMRFAYGL